MLAFVPQIIIPERGKAGECEMRRGCTVRKVSEQIESDRIGVPCDESLLASQCGGLASSEKTADDEHKQEKRHVFDSPAFTECYRRFRMF